MLGAIPRISFIMPFRADSLERRTNVSASVATSSFTVTLFHVIRGFSFFEQRYEMLFSKLSDEKWAEAGRQEMASVFEEARSLLIKAGLSPKRLTTKVVTGVSSRSAAILEEAREGRYGTILVGRRGLSKVMEFTMGRVGRKVIQMARDHAVWMVN